MDIRAVERFLAVAESSSFNKAAQRLNISQPALARSIDGLEYGLGVPLFDRTPRGVTLTSYGKLAYDHARRMSSEARRLRREIEAVQNLEYGELTVGVPLGQTSGVLAAAALALLGEGRRIKVNLVSGTRTGLLRLLLLGDLDFLFSALYAADDIPAGILQQPFYADRIVIVVRRGHPAARRRQPKLEDLRRRPWILLGLGREFEPSIRAMMGAEFDQSVLRSGSPIFVRNILAGSDFVGLTHRDAVSSELQSGELVELDAVGGPSVRDIFFQQEIGAIQRADVAPTRVALEFLTIMGDVMRRGEARPHSGSPKNKR